MIYCYVRRRGRLAAAAPRAVVRGACVLNRHARAPCTKRIAFLKEKNELPLKVFLYIPTLLGAALAY
jgi:hypothetical protein